MVSLSSKLNVREKKIDIWPIMPLFVNPPE